MNLLYQVIFFAVLAGGLAYFLVDYGRDMQREKCARSAVVQAESNINVERLQNEIRNSAPSDAGFIDVLRDGKFGRLPN